MTDDNFTRAVTVRGTPEAAFAAITNVRGWWSENIRGRTDEAGTAFDYAYKDAHRARIEVTELSPGQRVVWRVLENHFNFTKDQEEWTGDDIFFEITPKGEETEIRFSHVGLVPEYECYEACTQGWSYYVGTSLKALIETGKGNPNVGEGLTETERRLSA
jgi:uncharacterized protein YndB with AHSA1/START domain